MSVECKSVILVGIPYSKATWDNLTDEVKNDLIDEEIHKSPIDPYDSDIGAERDEFAEQAKEYFNENKFEVLQDHGIDGLIGNHWSGELYYVGVDVESISLHYTYANEISAFKRVFNLEPDLRNGELWY